MSIRCCMARLSLIWVTLTLLSGCLPDIEFSSEKHIIDNGASVRLNWEVKPFDGTDIASVDINQGVGNVAASGDTIVSPVKNTRYTLTAVANNMLRSRKSVNIIVSNVCIENTVTIPASFDTDIPGLSYVRNIIPLCDGLLYYTRGDSLFLHNVLTNEILQQHSFDSRIKHLQLDRVNAQLYFIIDGESALRRLDIMSGSIAIIEIEKPVYSMHVDDSGDLFYVDSSVNSLGQYVSSVYKYDFVQNDIETIYKDQVTDGIRGTIFHNSDTNELLYTLRTDGEINSIVKAEVLPETEDPNRLVVDSQLSIRIESHKFQQSHISPDFSTIAIVGGYYDWVEIGSVDIEDLSYSGEYGYYSSSIFPRIPVAFSPDGKYVAFGRSDRIQVYSSSDFSHYHTFYTETNDCSDIIQVESLSYSTNGEYIYGTRYCGDKTHLFYRKMPSEDDHENVAPVAIAGPDQESQTGSTVQLDGSGSYDQNNDPLQYSWSIVRRPETSIVDIVDPNSKIANFSPDIDGTYEISLVVNDGELVSSPDSIIIEAFTMPASAPQIETIFPAEVSPGTLVTVIGSGFEQIRITLNHNSVFTTERSPTSLRFTAPNLAPGTYELIVSNRKGIAKRDLVFNAPDTSTPDLQVELSGLPAGAQIKLKDSFSGEERTLGENGPYTLLSGVSPQSNYELTIVEQPPGYHCSGINLKGMSTINSVSSIKVDCIPSVEIPDSLDFAIRGELRDVGVGRFHTCYIDAYGTHCLGDAPDYGSMPALGCEYDPVDPCPSRQDMLDVPLHPEMGHPHRIDVGNNQACAMEGDIIYCWLGYTFDNYLSTRSSLSTNLLSGILVNEYEICSIENSGAMCRNSGYHSFLWDNPVDVDINSDTICALYSSRLRCDGRFFNIDQYVGNVQKVTLNSDSSKVCVQLEYGLQCFTSTGSEVKEGIPDIQDVGFVGDKICALTSVDLKCWGSLSSPHESTEFNNPQRFWSEDKNYCVETASELICTGAVNKRIVKL